MTQPEKTDLKVKTAEIRGKLMDNSNVLQEIMDNHGGTSGDVTSELGARIGVSNSIKELVDAVDAYIDEHAA